MNQLKPILAEVFESLENMALDIHPWTVVFVEV